MNHIICITATHPETTEGMQTKTFSFAAFYMDMIDQQSTKNTDQLICFTGFVIDFSLHIKI